MAGGVLKPGSQYGEDEAILKIFQGMRGGSAVDVGAADGYHHSNLHRLITEYEWNALLIEPHPVLVAEARKRYAGNTRVRVVQSAVKATPGTCPLHLYEPSYYGQVSTTVEEFKQQVILQHGDQFTKTVSVPCDTTRALIAKMLLTHINFMNVDCEGAEVDVLGTFPFDTDRPELFVVEMAMNIGQINGIMNDNEYVQLQGLRRYQNAFFVPVENETEISRRLNS